MNLTQHPEYKKYLKDQEIMEAIKMALTPWLEDDDEAGKALKTAVSQLTILFQEYNRVMWQEFPFCQMCLGGCCVVGASEVAAIDAAALTILGYDLPVLPAQTHHNERACIYLGERGCTWPADWRPLKCMTFFSLGSGDWELESSDERYDRLTEALRVVFDKYLPAILGANHEIDTQKLAEPIEFSATLSQRLAKQFLPNNSSLHTHPPSFPPEPDPTTTALLAIAIIIEKIMANPPANIDQLLIDVEQFEWVVTGHPAQEDKILAEINGRYAAHTLPLSLQFSQDIQQYRQSTHQKNMEDS